MARSSGNGLEDWQAWDGGWQSIFTHTLHWSLSVHVHCWIPRRWYELVVLLPKKFSFSLLIRFSLSKQNNGCRVFTGPVQYWLNWISSYLRIHKDIFCFQVAVEVWRFGSQQHSMQLVPWSSFRISFIPPKEDGMPPENILLNAERCF